MKHRYWFLLDSYQKKMEQNWDILKVRKAISETIANESFQIRQQYRHEMAKKRREEMENARVMNHKMKELREKEKEIARRYRLRNQYGHLYGSNNHKVKPKAKDEQGNESTITVLLPRITSKENPVTNEFKNPPVEYEVHSIPKKLLPSGKDEINAYKVVKKRNSLYEKCGEHRLGNDDVDVYHGGSGGILETLDGKTLKPAQMLAKNRLEYFNSKASKKHFNSMQLNHETRPQQNRYYHRQGLLYEEILNYYRNGGGLYRDDGGLSVFGRSKNANKYELLIVDEGPRTEEIRVQQRSTKSTRAYDILTIKENVNHSNSPRD